MASDSMSGQVIIAIVAAVAGSATTALLGIFLLGWKFVRRVARLEASNDRLWEKVIMVRKVIEKNEMTVPDREWAPPNSSGQDD